MTPRTVGLPSGRARPHPRPPGPLQPRAALGPVPSPLLAQPLRFLVVELFNPLQGRVETSEPWEGFLFCSH